MTLNTIRTAIVINQCIAPDSLRRTQSLLPSNYAAVEVADTIVIVGNDVAGWTLDAYVIPRLASGLITVQEVPR